MLNHEANAQIYTEMFELQMSNMIALSLFLILFANFQQSFALEESDLPWTYVCSDNKICKRIEYTQDSSNPKQSLAVCRLLCSGFKKIWPRVVNTPETFSDLPLKFCPGNLNLRLSGKATDEDKSFINTQLGILQRTSLNAPCSIRKKTVLNINVNITAKAKSSRISFNTDESYKLSIGTDEDQRINITINAANTFGSRHAFMTLRQMIVYDKIDKCYVTVQDAFISDFPYYPFRGVMLDTSRNFVSLEQIRILIDVMSLFKLNTFHWHITDSHSFPYNTPAMPQMAYNGAYSEKMSYSRDEVAEISRYALLRGIRVLPELDMPAHTGFGWQWGEEAGLGKLVLCEGKSPWETYGVQPPSGQLNVVNPNIFSILEILMSDLYNATNSDVFHVGGDEVHFNCWNETEDILNYMKNNGIDLSSESYHHLWGNFTLASYESLKRAYKNSDVGNEIGGKPDAIFWTSTLTHGDYLKKFYDPESSIIMYWENLASGIYVEDILKANLRMILSNNDRNYMDCGFPHYVNDQNVWCSPYKDWVTVYNNNYKDTFNKLGINASVYKDLILGGEILLWTESTNENAFLFKFIPRLLAAAERWWTFPEENVDDETRSRFEYVQLELAEKFGYKNRMDMVTPEWCVQNPTSCK